MADPIQCATCKTALGEEYGTMPRQPCPVCGSTARIFHARLEATALGVATLRATATVTRARDAFASGGLLVSAVVTLGERTDEGFLVEAVTLPWLEIIGFLLEDPARRFQIPWRKWEEIIAGAYRKAGFEVVTLTPRSRDRGRDVIAVKREGGVMVGSVRIIDQVKAYGPGNLVPAEDVRSLVGALFADERPASKAVLTATTDFAPRVRDDAAIEKLIPHRLELVNGTELIKRLAQLSGGAK